MEKVLLIVHVFIAAGLIGLVLIQHGKGADAGAAFGSGASSTVFGARGSASFLTRLTAILATLFFVSSFALGYLTLQAGKEKAADIVPEVPVAAEPAKIAPLNDDLPVVPAAPGNADSAAPADTGSTVPAESDVPKIPE